MPEALDLLFVLLCHRRVTLLKFHHMLLHELDIAQLLPDTVFEIVALVLECSCIIPDKVKLVTHKVEEIGQPCR